MFRSASSLIVLLAASTAPAVEFHVAPSGNDDNPGTQDAPLATLEGARDAIRALKAQGPLCRSGPCRGGRRPLQPCRTVRAAAGRQRHGPGADRL